MKTKKPRKSKKEKKEKAFLNSEFPSTLILNEKPGWACGLSSFRNNKQPTYFGEGTFTKGRKNVKENGLQLQKKWQQFPTYFGKGRLQKVEINVEKMSKKLWQKHQTKRRKRKTTKSVKMSTNSDKIWEGTLINGRQKFRLKHQQNNLLCKHQLCKTSTRHGKTTLIFLEGTLTKLQQNGRQKIERSRQ